MSYSPHFRLEVAINMIYFLNSTSGKKYSMVEFPFLGGYLKSTLYTYY